MAYRREGTNRNGGNFTEQEIEQVWRKGVTEPGWNPAVYRKDACGATIQRDKHGDTTPGGYGWEIDHKLPVAHGGSDDLSNLQPLQWENNRAKSDRSQLVCVRR